MREAIRLGKDLEIEKEGLQDAAPTNITIMS
jgi:hypothetical protein